jgi:hypothetical protein
MIIGIILIVLGLSMLGIDMVVLKPFIGIALIGLGIITIYQWYQAKRHLHQ